MPGRVSRGGDGPPGLPRPCPSGVGWAVRLNKGSSVSFIPRPLQNLTLPGTVTGRDAEEQGVPTAKWTGRRGATQQEAVRESRAQSRGRRQIRGPARAQGGRRQKGLELGVGGAALVRSQGRGRPSAPLPWAWSHPWAFEGHSPL